MKINRLPLPAQTRNVSLQFHRIIRYWFCILIIVISPIFLGTAGYVEYIFGMKNKIKSGTRKILTIFGRFEFCVEANFDDILVLCVQSDERRNITSVYRSVCEPNVFRWEKGKRIALWRDRKRPFP